MKKITSVHNPEIKSVCALRHAKERKEQKRFVAEGLRTCTTLINEDAQLISLYVTDDGLEKIKHEVSSEHITLVNDHVMEKMSQAVTPSGILGVFSIPQPLHPSTLQAGMVLAQISDPGNMGTLMRSCAAMNVPSVVIIEGADPWSFKVVQATAGFIASISLFQLTWNELLHYKRDVKLCALVVSGDKDPEAIDFKNTLLVIGSEAHGIPQPWLNDCDEYCTIPMPGKIESLNAAVAGSIALYMAWRKR